MHVPFAERLRNIPGAIGIRLVEQPIYEVLERDGLNEIRQYHPFVLAKVKEEGTHDSACSRALEKLADYVYAHDIPLAPPVWQERGEGHWTVSVPLPSLMLLQDLPTIHAGIIFRKMPPQLVAAQRFGGPLNLGTMEESAAALLEWLKHTEGYRTTGSPRWAAYDTGYVLPFLRRNEAQYALRATH